MLIHIITTMLSHQKMNKKYSCFYQNIPKVNNSTNIYSIISLLWDNSLLSWYIENKNSQKQSALIITCINPLFEGDKQYKIDYVFNTNSNFPLCFNNLRQFTSNVCIKIIEDYNELSEGEFESKYIWKCVY